jgi:hypothetical protein
MQTGPVDPDPVTDELYALPLQEFTAARNARVAEARRAGDTARATSLKALRKPTVGAWLANLLVRQRTKEVDRLVALGTEVRGSRRLDGDRIRRVSKERADTIARLVRDARSLAAQQGQAISEAVLGELDATLEAAFADAASADAVRAGRLTTTLQYSGLGLLPDVAAVGGFRRPPTERPRPDAALHEAERSVEQAKREAARADTELQEARRAVRGAEKRAKDAHRTAAVAEKRLAGLGGHGRGHGRGRGRRG